MENTQHQKARTKMSLFVWIGIFLILSVLNPPVSMLLSGGHSAPRLSGLIQVTLLLGLYLVLVFKPSDARELNRIVDLEASAITLGIAMWTALFWDPIASGLHMTPQPSPEAAALFIFCTYLLSRGLVELKYRR